MKFFEKLVVLAFFSLLFVFMFTTFAAATDVLMQGQEIESYDLSEGLNDSVTAKIYLENGKHILVISGMGRMKEFQSLNEIPWLEYAERIVCITIEKGVKNLTEQLFYNCSSLKEIRVYERYVDLPVSKQVIPYTAMIYGHFNSSAHYYVYENYPSRFVSICDFEDGVCAECGFVCENHSGGEPSCTNGGSCQICGEEYISAFGHRLSAQISEKSATCYSSGMLSHRVCLDCGEYFDLQNQPTTKDTLEFTVGHNFGELRENIPPSCVDMGVIAHYECSFCKKRFNQEKEEISYIYIQPTGHIGGTATCLLGAVCENCDLVYTEVDLDNHIYGAEHKYNESQHWYECICTNKKDVCAHTLTDSVVKEPTELEMGVQNSVCICGYEISKYIPRLQSNNNDMKDANTFSVAKLIIVTVAFLVLSSCVVTIVILIKKYIRK